MVGSLTDVIADRCLEAPVCQQSTKAQSHVLQGGLAVAAVGSAKHQKSVTYIARLATPRTGLVQTLPAVLGGNFRFERAGQTSRVV
jgi:hypothetical protein